MQQTTQTTAVTGSDASPDEPTGRWGLPLNFWTVPARTAGTDVVDLSAFPSHSGN